MKELRLFDLGPVRWKKDGETWVLCNFASQQSLLRTLDGLTTLTGDTKYRTAAEEATRDALNLTAIADSQTSLIQMSHLGKLVANSFC